MAQEGWICPRCGKVNAPWVMQCFCNRNTQILPKVGAPYYKGEQAMSKEKAIKHIKTIKSYITCIHEDLSEGKKIKPFGLAYKFAIQECDKALKELEE